MVAIRSIFLSTLALGSTLATATKKSCMTNGQALQVLKNWQNLIGDYSSELADAALTPDFTDYSASAADLNNVCPQAPVKSPPLDKPLFTSRDQFKQGQGGQPPIKSKILKHWHDCTTVSMRWKMTNLGSREVFGLIAFDTIVVRDALKS